MTVRRVDRQAGLEDRHIARAPAEVAGEAGAERIGVNLIVATRTSP